MTRRTPADSVLRFAGPAALALTLLLPLGCGNGSTTGGSHTTPASHAIKGKIFGGQQPVQNSQVYMYAAGSSTSGSRSMLNAPGFVLSGTDGSFDLTNDYTCEAGDQVYLLALGGDAGSGANSAIGLMAALGPCGALADATYVTINEVTTVASVYALLNYITSPTAVGADPVGSNAVAAAFANVKTMADVSTGLAPATVTGSGVVPQATINSLANSIAGCINSSLTTSTCANLLSYSGAPANSNTAQATIDIALNPTNNAALIYALAEKQPPFGPVLGNPPSSWAINVAFPADVLTYHNNTARTGVQPYETALTPAALTSGKFGKLFTFPVDGFLYAAPLFVGGLGMPDGNLHNVVYAASANGTVYAFDSDGNNPSTGYLWRQSLFAAGEKAQVTADYGNCHDTVPNSGLMGTPVIDRSTNTLYAVSAEKVTVGGAFTQKIHAISLIDGSEKFGGPTIITATYPGTGDGAVSGVLTFDAIKQNQRPALLLANGTVWITWASHCDIKNYHGYVIGYSASDVTKQTVLFNNTPNGSDGGIWLSGGGPAVDADGNVYVLGGNGTFDANVSGGLDYGDTALKLAPPSSSTTSPTVLDYFVPAIQASLSGNDQDVGITEPTLFDDPASGVAPHLLVETDKTGRLYLLNTTTGSMGGYNGPSGADKVIQEFTLGGQPFNSYSYFNGTLYLNASGGPVRAYKFLPGTSTTAGKFNTVPSSAAPTTAGGSYAVGGSCPVVSANGTQTAVVWMMEHTAVSGQTIPLMRAYDATNLATELYNTGTAAANADEIPAPVKFTCPTVANGRVFVGGQTALAVYGLNP